MYIHYVYCPDPHPPVRCPVPELSVDLPRGEVAWRELAVALLRWLTHVEAYIYMCVYILCISSRHPPYVLRPVPELSVDLLRGEVAWRQLAVALLRWLTHVEAVASAKASLLLCVQTARERGVERALRVWDREAARRGTAVEVAGRAVRRMRSVRVASALARWGLRTRQGKEARRRLQGAILRLRSLGLGRILASWRRHAAGRLRHVRSLRSAASYFVPLLLRKIWLGWYSLVEMDGRPLLARAATLWRGSLAARCFRGLARYRQRKRTRRSRNQLALWHNATRLAAPNLSRWRSALAEKQGLTEITSRFVRRLRSGALARVWEPWRAAATTGAAERSAARAVVERMRQRGLRMAISSWVGAADGGRDLRCIGGVVRTRAKRVRLAGGL